MDYLDYINDIQSYYDAEVEEEWNRISDRPEFLITCRFLDRYIRPGDRVLDVGGGPGRYALWLAEMGCDVTLMDLSAENLRFAKTQAKQKGLSLQFICGDAREADTISNQDLTDSFDHVLLMGSLYHLLEENDRIKAIDACLRLLKPGGSFSATFINLYSGLIYNMKFAPENILDKRPEEVRYLKNILDNNDFSGNAFTHAHFIRPMDVLPFMAQFPLQKLHFFGQESILSPCERNIMTQSESVVNAWINLAESIAERDELISWSEHLMYMGKKIKISAQ